MEAYSKPLAPKPQIKEYVCVRNIQEHTRLRVCIFINTRHTYIYTDT